MAQVSDCRVKLSLLRGARTGNDGARSFSRQSRSFEPACQVRVVLAGHIDHKRCAARGELAPIRCFAAPCLVSREKHNRRRLSTVRKRNFRCGRSAQRGRYPRHDLVRHTGPAQSFNFFAGAAEDHRIARFQSNNLQARIRKGNHQEVDFFLLNLLFSAALPYVVNSRGRRNQLQNLGGNQIVVKHGFGRLQKMESAHRKQFGITRSRPHEKDFAFQARSPFEASSGCCSNAASTASRLARECSSSNFFSLSRSLPRITLLI